MAETDLENLMASLVDQARSMAIRVAGNPERDTQCHFCDAGLPLWENLLVLQLTGVAAHVECPSEALAEKLRAVGPAVEFPYEEFSRAVEVRLGVDRPAFCSGVIEAI